MPTVWWPGSRDVLRSEGKLRWKSYSGSSSAISFNLFRHNLVNCNSKCRVRFFLRRFLQHLVCKNRGTNRSMAPPGHFR
ncbi:hypothetical protein CY35_06G120500 [Sphagnum magellanicum]|nr:hypothetical protein CY35_06G120500 [Sphagnum magellanicum]